MLFASILQLTFFPIGSEGIVVVEGDAIVAFFKLLFVTLAFLYLLFAFVVTRQIKIMRNTLVTSFSPIVKFVGYAHLLMAFAVFVFFVLFL